MAKPVPSALTGGERRRLRACAPQRAILGAPAGTQVRTGLTAGGGRRQGGQSADGLSETVKPRAKPPSPGPDWSGRQ